MISHSIPIPTRAARRFPIASPSFDRCSLDGEQPRTRRTRRACPPSACRKYPPLQREALLSRCTPSTKAHRTWTKALVATSSSSNSAPATHSTSGWTISVSRRCERTSRPCQTQSPPSPCARSTSRRKTQTAWQKGQAAKSSTSSRSRSRCTAAWM